MSVRGVWVVRPAGHAADGSKHNPEIIFSRLVPSVIAVAIYRNYPAILSRTCVRVQEIHNCGETSPTHRRAKRCLLSSSIGQGTYESTITTLSSSQSTGKVVATPNVARPSLQSKKWIKHLTPQAHAQLYNVGDLALVENGLITAIWKQFGLKIIFHNKIFVLINSQKHSTVEHLYNRHHWDH